MEIKLHYVLTLQENHLIPCILGIWAISKCRSKVDELQEHKPSINKDLNQCKRSGSQNLFLSHIDKKMHPVIAGGEL